MTIVRRTYFSGLVDSRVLVVPRWCRWMRVVNHGSGWVAWHVLGRLRNRFAPTRRPRIWEFWLLDAETARRNGYR